MSKHKKKDAGAEPHHFFVCLLCDAKATEPQLSPKELTEHLVATHGWEMPIRGSRKLSMHMDATTWYQSDYEWYLNDQVFAAESIRLLRTAEDAMYWTDFDDK